MTEIEEDNLAEEISDQKSTDQKSKDKKSRKDKVKALTKVVIRRLPPSMTEEIFLKQCEPLPHNDYFYFVPADWSLGQNASSRAYINFVSQEDVFLFKDKFDGYVFVDTKGVEYPAVVEFAPFQGLPKGKSRKKDNKCNTIEQDPHFISFLASLTNADSENNKTEQKMEYSYQIKDDKKITSTPLLEYIANKKLERREERRKKNEDKKKQREEEKNRKKDPVSFRFRSGSSADDNSASATAEDKKRQRDTGKNRKKDISKSIPSSIPEEDNSDGIIVRTVKSRIMERGDRGKNKDRIFESKQHQQSKAEDDTTAGVIPKIGKDDRIERERGERDRKRAERNEQRKAANLIKEAARRKEKKLRKNERSNRKEDSDKDNTGVDQERDKSKTDDSRLVEREYSDSKNTNTKDERVKKYSENRRDRRRGESKPTDNTTKTDDAARPAKRGEEIVDENTEEKTIKDPEKLNLVGDGKADKSSVSLDSSQTTQSTMDLAVPVETDAVEQREFRYQSQTSIDDDEGSIKSQAMDAKDERRQSIDSKHDSSSGGDNSRDNSKAKQERNMNRIRNKDRPSLQIYQPGRRRVPSSSSNPGGKADDAKSGDEKTKTVPNSPTEKSSSKDEFNVKQDDVPVETLDANNASKAKLKDQPPVKEFFKPEPIIRATAAVQSSEKRVSRYSERRNKNKERISQRDVKSVENNLVADSENDGSVFKSEELSVEDIATGIEAMGVEEALIEKASSANDKEAEHVKSDSVE